MEAIRILPRGSVRTTEPCGRCQASGHFWDRIMGKPFCPDCEETLIKGESAPLVEKAERRRCAICAKAGTLRYLTYPLESVTPLEMDLCAEHFRALLGRCLDRAAFEQLRRLLREHEVDVEQIFLLHNAFYDAEGQALQPAVGGQD